MRMLAMGLSAGAIRCPRAGRQRRIGAQRRRLLRRVLSAVSALHDHASGVGGIVDDDGGSASPHIRGNRLAGGGCKGGHGSGGRARVPSRHSPPVIEYPCRNLWLGDHGFHVAHSSLHLVSDVLGRTCTFHPRRTLTVRSSSGFSQLAELDASTGSHGPSPPVATADHSVCASGDADRVRRS